MTLNGTQYIQSDLDFHAIYNGLLNSSKPTIKYVAPACPVSHPGCYSVLVGSALVKEKNSFAVGSYAPQDVDYLTYVPTARMFEFVSQIIDDGWTQDGNYEGAKFVSYRKNEFNLILTEDYEWFKKFHKAAKLCARLCLTNKNDRITVHEAFLEEEKEE
jgi:hypothetical protein